MTSGPATSPLATGGAGTIYEYRVAAVVLAALLRGDRVEGLDVPATEVRFQQRNAGHPLDDVIVHARHTDRVPLTVEFQVKRTLAPVRSNQEWASVIRQCVAAIAGDRRGVELGHRLLGVAASGPARQLADLSELTEWARAHPEPAAFTAVASADGVVSARVRERWAHLQDTVHDVLTDTTGTAPSRDEADRVAFLIAAALRVWIVEVEDGQRDHRAVLNRLDDLVRPDQPDAAYTLFLHLADIAQTRGPRAGGISRQMLVAELERRQIRLATDTDAGQSPARAAPSPALITNLPPRNRTFSGREDLLTRLADGLSRQPVPVVAAHGLGGIGKTQVALEYAHRHRADYTIMWWVRAESPVTIAADLASLGPWIGLPSIEDQDDAVAAVKAALADRRDWLLVFDNAPYPASVDRFLPVGAGHVVITSRTRDWGEVAQPLQVDLMTEQEAQVYLRIRTGRDETKAAAELAKQLGYLPLALAQAGGYVAAYGTSIAGYLALYQQAAARLLAAGPAPAGYPRTVATTWLLHFEALTRTHPAAVDVLNLCAFLAPDMIPIGLLLDAAPPDALSGALATAATDPLEREAAVGALVATSLLDRVDDHIVGVHRLVQEITRPQLSAEHQQAWATCALRLLMAAFPDHPDQPPNWTRAGLLTVHGLTAIQRATNSGAAATKDWADLLNAMGIHLAGQADLVTAKDLYERALTMRQKVYGPDHPEVAVTLDNLGLLLTRMGELHAAHELHRRALAIKLAASGPMHPAVALTFTNLGAVLSAMGDYTSAHRVLLQALAIDEAAHGPDHPEVASDLRDIGISLTNVDDPAAAIAPLRRALAIYKSAHGAQDPQVAQTLDALGYALHRVGDHAAARDHLQRALAIAEATYGPDHPQAARTLTNLADVLDDLGDHETARAHLERALTIVEATHGPNHPDVGRVLMTLSVVLDNLNDRRMIRAYRQRAYGILHAALGPHHPDTQRAALGLSADIEGI